MTLPTKLGIGALALGSAGVATYAGITQAQKGTPIKELIEKEYEYILLNTSDSKDPDKTHWATVWASYAQENKDELKLEGWATRNGKDLIPKLKQKCSELSDLTVSNNKDNTYQNVTKYCARSVSISDEAKKLNLKVLDISDNGGEDTSIWADRESKKATLERQIKELKIEFNSVDASKIREGCKTITTTNKKDPKYKDIFESYRTVCTKS